MTAIPSISTQQRNSNQQQPLRIAQPPPKPQQIYAPTSYCPQQHSRYPSLTSHNSCGTITTTFPIKTEQNYTQQPQIIPTTSSTTFIPHYNSMPILQKTQINNYNNSTTSLQQQINNSGISLKQREQMSKMRLVF